MMTIADKYRLILLLVEYLKTDPLSHGKRTFLLDVVLNLLHEISGIAITTPTDPDEIPF